MKKQMTTFLAIALLASAAYAQDSSRMSLPSDEGVSSNGFRVALVKPFFDATVTASAMGETHSSSVKLDNVMGFSVGYANLPVQQIGGTGNFSYLQISDGGTATLLRLDGNVGYAFNSLLNLKGGLNISNVSGAGDLSLSPAIGLQASLGLQFTKNIGLDIGYAQLNQTASVAGVNVNLKEAGMELGLNATF